MAAHPQVAHARGLRFRALARLPTDRDLTRPPLVARDGSESGARRISSTPFRLLGYLELATYRDAVEQATRDDIAAAAAAHRELGRDYDSAVAEGLVDRIGLEIDKRIDARLGASPRRSHSPAEIAQAGRHQAFWTGTGIGAGLTGLTAILAHHNGGRAAALVIVVWIILAIAGLGTTLVRKYRRALRK